MGFLNAHVPVDERGKKILNEFNNLEGLNEIIKGILNLKDSKIYERFYEASLKDPNEMRTYIDTIDDLLELRQVKLATGCFKDPPLYLPFLTDVIISTHFNATFSLISGIDYAYAQKKLGHESTVKEHAVLERLMSLLDNFDKSGEFQKPDTEFYQKLKKIKWNKTGKKLFWKLYDIRGAINLRRWGTETDVFESGENFALTFLAACNAVHNDRDKMLKEDVVKAYKTYLKLLNTDISKLM